ncbi:hypothetical protein O3W44_00030 [Pantoea sp. LMR881]|uniref:hypothetical protein n=1 Tax=Pantoea sp. LMR881 TaxID=3014336 RepID=UPI0022AF3AC4|nr:hypothetical protein [Pantoea sp. LMR881]MCZ4057798.1 hypothetical protein [Pantoea sp. LMR881]
MMRTRRLRHWKDAAETKEKEHATALESETKRADAAEAKVAELTKAETAKDK